MRRCLLDCDVVQARRLWAHIAPSLPQPKTDAEALIVIHMARTQAEFVPLRQRAYSHSWLIDHNLPSQLPDALKPLAQRLYPRIVDAVGISLNFRDLLKPIKPTVLKAMENEVMDLWASNKKEGSLVRRRLREVRDTTVNKLMGKLFRED